MFGPAPVPTFDAEMEVCDFIDFRKADTMSYRRIAAAAVTAWIVSIPFGALIHHGVLGGVYAANAAAFRPDADIVRRLPIGYAVQLLGFFGAAFLCAETSPRPSGIVRGIRFGLLMGVVVVSFAVIWNYVTQPITALVGVAEVFECMLASSIYGAIIGAIYRPIGSVDRV